MSERGFKAWPVVVGVGAAAMFAGLMVGRTRTPAPGLPGRDVIPEWVPPFLAVAMIVGVAAWLIMPLVRAWARRIEGHGADPATEDELMQIRDRVAELEMTAMRMQELEERLDFAERLLAQHHDAPPLPLHRTPV